MCVLRLFFCLKSLIALISKTVIESYNLRTYQYIFTFTYYL